MAKSQRLEPPESGKSLFREYAEAIGIAILLALFIRTFFIQAFKIPSGSMLQTLQIGDHILVNKLGYAAKSDFTISFSKYHWKLFSLPLPQWRKPEKGDIVVFTYPLEPERDFIKRVVAVEGDIVSMRNKQLIVNGEEVKEGYIQHEDDSILSPMMGKRDNFDPIKIAPGSLFVMGDNRDNSHDSRFWGQLDLKMVQGKAMIVYFSWDGGVQRNWGFLAKIPLLGNLCFDGAIRWERFGRILR